jgi:hypothetical protein
VDRMTLNPGRRVSKAGLESLRPNDNTRASPLTSPGIIDDDKKFATPGVEGRLDWI